MRNIRLRTTTAAAVLTVVVAAVAGPPIASAFDPEVEAKNYSKGQERKKIYDTPAYQALLAEVSTQNEAAAAAIQATDPERNFMGHLCARATTAAPATRACTSGRPTATGSSSPCSSPRAAAPRSPARLGDESRPQQASRDRDHERLGTGRRAALLVRGANAREGRVRRAHLRPPGPGTVRRAGTGARRKRRLSRADRRPSLLRRHRGCDQLLPLDTKAPLRASSKLQHRHKPCAQAEPARKAGLDAPYNPFWEMLNPSGLASPDTHTAPRAFPTSVSGIHA